MSTILPAGEKPISPEESVALGKEIFCCEYDELRDVLRSVLPVNVMQLLRLIRTEDPHLETLRNYRLRARHPLTQMGFLNQLRRGAGLVEKVHIKKAELTRFFNFLDPVFENWPRDNVFDFVMEQVRRLEVLGENLSNEPFKVRLDEVLDRADRNGKGAPNKVQFRR